MIIFLLFKWTVIKFGVVKDVCEASTHFLGFILITSNQMHGEMTISML